MRKLILTLFAFTAIKATGTAQTLFQFGNSSVTKDEFLKVYQKNSLNKKADMTEPALREYLDLYSLFRMKVKEAEAQQIDTVPSIQYELDNYRKQLSKNYLTDDKVNEKLIQEAYDRMKEEVHVKHILITSSQYSASIDTVEPYRKIDSLYNVVSKGKASFEKLAEQFSDDGATKATGGDMGYITALQTIYAFENVVYATPVGKISKPFRTQFGYHILKVIDKRPASGQTTLAHILIAAPKSKGAEGLALAHKRMDTVRAELKKGASFEALVKKYSDDKFTVESDGLMKPFGVGEYTPDFERVAFGLKKKGDISEPLETDYGVHILKLIDRTPLKPFDTLRPSLKRKVENDSRAQVAKEAFFTKIKQQNNFKEYTANVNELATRIKAIPDTGKNANAFKAADFADMSKPVFTFNGKDYKQSDLMRYMENMTRGRLAGPRNTIVTDMMNFYVKDVLNDYEEQRLMDQNPEFKSLMQEYKDGIMLFELMDRNVWSKASRDTVGLKAFHETRKNKYMWEPGFTGSIYMFKNEEKLKEGQKLMGKKGITDEEIMKKMNTDATPDAVVIQRGHYEFSKMKELQPANVAKGTITAPQKNEGGTYTVIKVDDVFSTPTPKSLDEAKGYVVAEYQDYLEKTWNEQIRKKYPMTVNDQVFKSMVQ